MDCFADETLAADGMVGIVDALGGKSSRWAFKGLMAVRKSHDEVGITLFDELFEGFDRGNSVEKKVAVAGVRLFFYHRF